MRHNPRCAIYNDPPSLRDAKACNCGAIPELNPSGDEDWKDQLRFALEEYDAEKTRAEKTVNSGLGPAIVILAGQALANRVKEVIGA